LVRKVAPRNSTQATNPRMHSGMIQGKKPVKAETVAGSFTVHLPDLFHNRRCDIWTFWVYIERPCPGDNDKVYVLHRNRAEKNFVTHHKRGGETDAILEVQFHWPHIGKKLHAAVCQHGVFLRDLLQLKLMLHL